VALSTMIVLLIAGLGLGYWAWNTYQAKVDMVEIKLDDKFIRPQADGGPAQPVMGSNIPRPTPDIVKEPFNVMLVGVDVRADTSDARTDTIIVIHIDPQHKWSTMVSIPRDSCAEIPGYYENGECWKINAAYEQGYRDARNQDEKGRASGGLTLTRDTVEKYLGLPARGQKIDYVAQVDFNGFKQIINSLGGINLNVTKPLWDPVYPTDDDDNGFIRLYIPAGYQHMDGVTALRYARSRHQDTDYGRSQRQQDVIRAVVQAIKEKGLFDQIEQLNQLATDLEGYVFTDLPIRDIGNVRALASLGSELAQGRIQTIKWDTSADIGGPDINTPIWDPATIEATVDAMMSGPIPNTNQPAAPEVVPTEPDTAVKVEVMNGASIRGLAGDVSTHLSNRGYTITTASTAFDVYDDTTIVDYGDNKQAREQLAALLGIKPKNILLASRAPEQPTDPTSDLVVLLGRDYQETWREP
jgi:LCP family protein required for cell wall assembly